MRRTPLLIAATAFLFTPPALADDWPEFRGPTGQGIANGQTLPIEWSPTKNVAWKEPIPGRGWSSPVIHDGRVYLTTSVRAEEKGRGQSLQALCLDAASGKISWKKEIFFQDGSAARIHTKNSHASP